MALNSVVAPNGQVIKTVFYQNVPKRILNVFYQILSLKTSKDLWTRVARLNPHE